MRGRGWLVVFACAVLFTWNGSAAAQPAAADDAESRFRIGREAMKRGQIEAALEDLAESYRLEPRPGTLLNLALCEDELGHLVSARAHLRAFLDEAAKADDRRELALRHLTKIEERIPHVTLRMDERARAAVKLRLDGSDLDPRDVQVALPLDPGEHTLVVILPGGTSRSSAFVLRDHQELIQMIDLSPDSGPVPANDPVRQSAPQGALRVAPPPPLHRRSDRGLRTAGWASGAMGLAALLGTSIAALEVLADKRTTEQHCGPEGCDSQGFDAARKGKTWSAVGSTLGAVAVTGLGLGSYLLLSAGITSSRTAVIHATVAF